MIQDIDSIEEFEKILSESAEKPVFLYKHSSTCPISAGTWSDLKKYVKDNGKALFYRVMVRENKQLSHEIAEKCGVKHQSPQMILFRDGKPVWKASHYAICDSAMDEALG
ncbi:MAG: bacillithiol system redox-active protein YtxJ [candidate division Zixibacteria bacterium]|jgi:bacillithiol system protein YtxJ|nr:bacillithiol system redox-active protein YtxJ [candidate division Zixibacteria bacterium]